MCNQRDIVSICISPIRKAVYPLARMVHLGHDDLSDLVTPSLPPIADAPMKDAEWKSAIGPPRAWGNNKQFE